MFAHVDYFAFTALFSEDKMRTRAGLPPIIRQAVDDLYHNLAVDLGMFGEYIVEGGRKPYNHSYLFLDTGVRMFCHERLGHALFEIPGAACSLLNDEGILTDIMRAAHPRTTRVDFAVDIECKTDPIEFATAGYSERFKAFNVIKSDDGTTYYVGSRTSERFARVYRYNEPHERAHLLRVEYELKGETARVGVYECLEVGVSKYVQMLSNVFEWKHKSWEKDAMTTEKPKGYRDERESGKTLFWLADTVAPLLVRMHKAKELDLFTWLTDNVIAELPDLEKKVFSEWFKKN